MKCIFFFCIGIFFIGMAEKCYAAPDLLVTSMAMTPSSQVPGGEVVIHYRILNSDDTSGTGGSFDVAFYYSTNSTITTVDTRLATLTIPELAPASYYPSSSNGQITLTLPETALVGTRYLGAIVDYNNEITESNENNNSRSAAITVIPLSPDLLVSTMIITPSSQVPGEEVTIRYRILNSDSSSATGRSFDVAFYYSTNSTITTVDTQLTTIIVPELAANAYYPAEGNGQITVTIPETAIMGLRYLGVIADYNANIAEDNENNNTRSTAITIIPTVSSPWVIFTPVILGSTQLEE